MMRPPAFTRLILLICSGPIIWAAHFLAVYGFTGVACARGLGQAQLLGINAVALVILVLTLAAMATVAWIVARMRNEVADGFVRWSTIALGLLACVALAWEALPVFFLQPCAW